MDARLGIIIVTKNMVYGFKSRNNFSFVFASYVETLVC